MKYVSPSVNETAFNCPHCGALAKQAWSSLHASHNERKRPLPLLLNADDERDFKDIEDDERRAKTLKLFQNLKTRRPFKANDDGTLYGDEVVYNVFVSDCFNCGEISLWVADKLVYPAHGEGPPANPDLPDDIRRDYTEASSILSLSPRGAAALLRLCIQKLCKHLNEPGKDINADIGSLVAKGLSVQVQQALDAVRVIGNNAVHPGKIDLTDDRAIAESLFRLLNLIADRMISEPKHVQEVYASLPPGVREQIEKRDKGKKE